MQPRPLDGQVAIVTGASRGIGRSIALALARNGACVSLAAGTESALRIIQSEIEAMGDDELWPDFRNPATAALRAGNGLFNDEGYQ